MHPSELGLVAKHVMRLLVDGRYAELDAATKGVRFGADDIAATVGEIGQALVMPPETAWQELDIVAIRNWPGAFNVVLDLWTARGRSDWSVELTLYKKDGRPVIELDDIHPH